MMRFKMNTSFFSKAPIKTKLTIMSLLVTFIALFLASTLIVVVEFYTQRKIFLKDLTIQANIIGKNSIAALLFEDYKAAEESLSSLKINPDVIYAVIYDNSKNIFASHAKTDLSEGTKNLLHPGETYKFDIMYLSLNQPILLDNEKIGSIYIIASLKSFYYRLLSIVLAVLAAIFISLSIVYLFILSFQKVVMKPLTNLTNIMQSISKSKNYSLRAQIHTNDEIGILSGEFNNMLNEIQKRDIELERYGKHLEEQVKNRTKDISIINAQLVDELVERKKIEKTLKEIEKKYRSLFDNLNDAAFLIDLQTDEIIETNSKGETLLGRKREEIVGLKYWIMFPPQYQADYIEKFNVYLGQFWGDTPTNLETNVIHISGKTTPIEISASIISFSNKNMVLGLFRDITERKETDKKIRRSLEEKELLIKEIHHRVKNNLQVILSLLYLQSENITETKILAIFHEIETKIKSIALIHEKLYQSEDLSHIDFEDYVKNLTAHLFSTYNINTSSIVLDVNVQHAFFPIDIATPCGLIINELVSNSLKYAFTDGRKGKIYINFSEIQDIKEDEIKKTYNLIVGDNGVGLAPHVEYISKKSLGLNLVYALVKQLSGDITFNGTSGAEFRIVFSRKTPKTDNIENQP